MPFWKLSLYSHSNQSVISILDLYVLSRIRCIRLGFVEQEVQGTRITLFNSVKLVTTGWISQHRVGKTRRIPICGFGNQQGGRKPSLLVILTPLKDMVDLFLELQGIIIRFLLFVYIFVIANRKSSWRFHLEVICQGF